MDCSACGAPIELASGERIAFRDCCPRCQSDLHACRNCGHHDRGAYNECREPNAERVSDRERANRCDWFTPRTRTGEVAPRSGVNARAALDALFKSRKT